MDYRGFSEKKPMNKTEFFKNNIYFYRTLNRNKIVNKKEALFLIERKSKLNLNYFFNSKLKRNYFWRFIFGELRRYAENL